MAVESRVGGAGRGERGDHLGRGVVAGMRLVAERRLRGCSKGRPIAGRLVVRAARRPPGGGGFVAPPGERGSAWLRLDGQRLLLAGEADWGRRVRRLVPYASWLQGLPLLHAACVRFDGTALALVGGSGVGKSTLAAGLARFGWCRLCDDLTPIRTVGGYGVARSPRRAIPLGALVFLRRGRARRPRLAPLGRAAALRALARHGWGDLALPSLWRAQFDSYAGLAAARPAVRLVMPDDPATIGDSTAAAAKLLAAI